MIGKDINNQNCSREEIRGRSNSGNAWRIKYTEL